MDGFLSHNETLNEPLLISTDPSPFIKALKNSTSSAALELQGDYF
jgi:hypothetical protein